MILGIIPARGGSKGVPRKNIRPICGFPLIAWTIQAARGSRMLERTIVSTEDDEIGRVAASFGAEVWPRPPELARDDTTTLAVLQHVLEGIPADVVVVLQATSPIRDADLIDRCLRRFLEVKPESLATGWICKYVPYGKGANLPRQALSGFFYDDGNVYVIRADNIRQGDRYGRTIEMVLTDREQNAEIDDEFDFWLAEKILEKRLLEGKQHYPNRRVM
jgi:CMP-N-acetylneuraminic acid synthetase